MATFDKVQNKSGTVWRFQIAIKGPAGTRRASGTRTTKAEAVIAAAEREAEIRRELSTGIQQGRTVDEAFRRYEKDVSAHKPGKRWEAIRLAAIGRMEIAGAKISDMLLSEVTSDTLGRLRDQRHRVACFALHRVKRLAQQDFADFLVFHRARRPWRMAEEFR